MIIGYFVSGIRFLESAINPIKVMNEFKIISSNPKTYLPNIPNSPSETPGAPVEKYHMKKVTMIEIKHINGTFRSLTFRFEIIPKKNIPINGP